MEQIYQQDVRNLNLQRVYEVVARAENASRSSVASALSLSKPAMSSIVDELIRDQLIEEAGYIKEPNAAGRKAMRLKTVSGRKFVAVVEWKEDAAVGRLVDVAETGQTCHSQIRWTVSNPTEYVDATVNCYNGLMQRLQEGRNLLGCAVIIPGIANPTDRSILAYPIGISADIGSRMIRALETKGIPAIDLVNDSAMLAYAELMHHRALQEQNVFYVNIAKGIGGVLYIQGKPFGDATGMLTQLGSLAVAHGPDMPSVRLENVVGEAAVKRQLQSVLPDLSDRPLGDGYYYRILNQEVNRHNSQAVAIVDAIADTFAHALSNVITVVVPDRLVIGGNGASMGEYFLERLQAGIRRYSVEYLIRDLRIDYSVLNADAIFEAAANYVFRKHYNYIDKNMNGFYIG